MGCFRRDGVAGVGRFGPPPGSTDFENQGLENQGLADSIPATQFLQDKSEHVQFVTLENVTADTMAMRQQLRCQYQLSCVCCDGCEMSFSRVFQETPTMHSQVRRFAVLAVTVWSASLFAFPATSLYAADPAPQELLGRKLVFFSDFESSGLDKLTFTDSKAWRLADDGGNHRLELFQQSKFEPPVRSPYNRALVTDVAVSSFVLDVDLQSTKKDYPHRDLCLFFGYQDDAHLYYVHFGKQADPHANQIFIVDGKPRLKISTETTTGTPWTDDWHHARLVRDDAGNIEVFFDDMNKPAMRAKDTTFGKGLVGVGSFDDVGKFDRIAVYSK